MSLSAPLEGCFPILNSDLSEITMAAPCLLLRAMLGMALCREPRSKGGGYRRDNPQNMCSIQFLHTPLCSPSLLAPEPLFLLTMSETSCGRLCSGMT